MSARNIFAVLIAVTLVAAESARAQQSRAVTLVGAPHVHIGTIDGPPATTFSGVVAAFRLNDGRIVIADGGNQVVRFYDPAGRHLGTVGRSGEGPGEFSNLRWAGLCPDGEIVAGDPMLGRVSVLAAEDGAFLRTASMPSWMGFNEFIGCAPAGVLIALANRPREVGPPDQVMRVPATIVSFPLENGDRTELLRLPGSDWYFSSSARGYSPLPLGGQAHAATSGTLVFGGQSDASEIHVLELATGDAAKFAHGLARRAATPALWQSAKTAIAAALPLKRTRDLVDEVLADAPHPELAPYFTDLAADHRGHVWLRLPSSEPTAVWQVFTADGDALGTVRLESNLRPLDIGERYIVALETDEFGVQFVRVYTFAEPIVVED